MLQGKLALWSQRALIVAVVLLTLWHHARQIGPLLGNASFDDAFMVARYARHWLAGQGFSWNAVDGPAYGITSSAFLLVITAVMGLTTLRDAWALTAASFTFGLLAVAAMVWIGFLAQAGQTALAQRDARARPRSWLPGLIAPAVMVSDAFGQHSLTGMETTLSLLCNSLLACSVLHVVRQRSPQASWLCALAGLASVLARPDNGLYALALPPLFFIATERALWRQAGWHVLGTLALIGGSLLFNHGLFGSYLPLPFYAKANGFYSGYLGKGHWHAGLYMLNFIGCAMPFLLVTLLAPPRQSVPRLLAVLAPVCLMFGYYATVTQIMGMHYRYYYPSLPFLVLAASVGLADRQRLCPPGGLPIGSGVTRIVLAGALLMGVNHVPLRMAVDRLWTLHVIGQPLAIQPRTGYATAARTALPVLGWVDSMEGFSTLMAGLPKGVSVAASEHGILGARFVGTTVIDLVGLHDATIAHHGFQPGYVVARQPDLIWLPHPDYSGEVAALLDHPGFQHDYDFYPGVFDHGLAVLKRSAQRQAALKGLDAAFAQTYPGQRAADHLGTPQRREARAMAAP
jgi:hypothetical protein